MFTIRSFEAKAGDRTGEAFELTNGTVRAEVWPMFGFNCLRWQVRQPDGSWGDILYTAPDWETNPVPTRSGHPILFPFPGRLRNGRLGDGPLLPLNDSTKQHAIHGFTPRNPWRRCYESMPNEEFALLGGVFNLHKDLSSAIGLWPNFEITVTYILSPDRLEVNAKVDNVGTDPLPFGLGYHPYFRLPGVTDADIGGHVLWADVSKVWEVDENNLPSGSLLDIPPHLDFRKARFIGGISLDHVFTGREPSLTRRAGEVAILSHPNATGQLRIVADESFRELVLFTPPHRQAIAIEPYTCSADAGNLQAQGIDSGWRTLAPGTKWEGRVEYVWESTP